MDTPADGAALPGGRIVVTEPKPAQPHQGPYPEGLTRLLGLIAAHMPKDEVESLWSFPGVRREGREYGVAVVSRRRASKGRIRVYRARYTLELKGEQRGAATLELEETAETPADLMARVIDGVARRADEAGDAELVDLAAWKAGE
jgi:hypothetical protein